MKHFILLLMMLLSSSMVWATGADAEPALNDDGTNDPHMSGCWLLMLDRNNNEIWYEMMTGSSDYYYFGLKIYSYIFGCKYYWDSQLCDYTPIDSNIPSRNYRGYEDIVTYDARFCYVIDGVRYGPEENYQEVVFGDTFSNPLVESNNYYTIMTGIIVNMGVAIDDDGKAYVYASLPGWEEETNIIPYNDNFPDPHKIGVWLLMLDRNNNEIWEEMYKEDNDCYSAFIRLYCHVFGCRYYSNMWFFNYTPIDPNIPSRRYADCEDLPTIYDARYCIVIDGVRYGPEKNYTESIPGNTTANPLAESNNYYTLKTGEFATVGVLFDEGGKAYAYVAYAMMSYSDPTQKWRENFPPYETNNNSSNGDVNGDGEINIGDVNAIIDIIQGH